MLSSSGSDMTSSSTSSDLSLQPVTPTTISSTSTTCTNACYTPSPIDCSPPQAWPNMLGSSLNGWMFGRKRSDEESMDLQDADHNAAASAGPQQSRKPSAMQDDASKTRLTPSQQIDPAASPSPGASSVSKASDSASARGLSNGIPAHHTSDHAVDDESSGMLSHLERQYNLSNREAPPPKRRKVDTVDDDEIEGSKPRSTFTGITSNGEIGQHMKEERQKAAASGPPAQAIDLTNDDDDDDVQIVSSTLLRSRENEQVCLGMLVAAANVNSIPRYSRTKKSNILGTQTWPAMRVYERRVTGAGVEIGLYDRPPGGGRVGTRFGKIEMKVASPLCDLLDAQSIPNFKMKLYLEGASRHPGEYEGATVSRLMRLRIILYAPRGTVIGIGKKLSHKQLWLRQPVPLERDVEVFNPHAAPVQLGGPIQTSKRQQQATYGVVRTQEEMVRETNSMFDNLVKASEIPEMEANLAAISTPLQGLQKQALHFMKQHERPHAEDDQILLWKPREKTKGTVWANVITNHELDARPEPVRGGILADEMGLGKTLSVLSLHASTLEEARQFGEAEAPMHLEEVSRNAKATLIICPKSVMTNWMQQIKEHTITRYFKCYQYHGPDRTQDLEELARYDIVLVPYGTVQSEFSFRNANRNALMSVNWFRVVLDEAHHIRTPSTQISKACCALSAQRRWAVTGTPVQNRLDDLGTLIKFLRIKPFDDETSWARHIMAPLKTADEHVLQHLQLLVASMTLRRTKDKVGLPKRVEHEEKLRFDAEERAMYAQFSSQANLQVRALTRDKGRIQGKGYAFMLRSIHRLRAICAHGREMLSEDDLKELEGLTAQTAIELGDEPDEGGAPDSSFITEKQAYDFLHMMMESESDLCTACTKKITRKDEEEQAKPPANEDSNDEEPDSDSDEESDDEEDLDSEAEPKKDTLGYINPCYDHLICRDCKDGYVAAAKENQRVDGYHVCPYCEQYIRFGLFELKRSALRSFLDAKLPKNKKQRTKWDEMSYSGPHTKVKALLEDLKETAMQSEMLPRGEPPYKSVIFSGWTNYLDLIEYALDEHDIKHIRLDGTMSVKQRTKVLDDFRDVDEITVILVSIKAGGQGLNLTSANKVYMMEPQFNPGVEQQAVDRVHRMGQKRDVEIKHFIMEESIEEKIRKMQERKQELAKLAMEKKLSKGEAAKKRVEELRELFK